MGRVVKEMFLAKNEHSLDHRSFDVNIVDESQQCLNKHSDELAEESPIALVYNGISHAVMLATPTDLEDFALGFSLTEGLINSANDLLQLEVVPLAKGIEINIRLSNECFMQFKQHRRALSGRSGCGLCGKESLEEFAPNAKSVSSAVCIKLAAIKSALQNLQASQSLQERTGGVHAAAWCDGEGNILLVREDIGRHNAIDKLIGALINGDMDLSTGFILMTSRASYEIIQKAAAVGIAALVAISAPTALAVELARSCGMLLLAFSSVDRQLVYSHSERLVF